MLISKESLLKKFESGALLFQPDVRRIIEDEPEAPRWIPVSERLPEKTGKYLVTVPNGNVYAGTYSAYDGKFNSAATAWMDLPEPYKEVADETD